MLTTGAHSLLRSFIRGNADRDRSGARLGLAIAPESAKRHGGEVSLDGVAHPTRFVLRLMPQEP